MRFDDDVPIPPRKQGGEIGKHLVDKMKIGQSTFIAGKPIRQVATRFSGLQRRRPGWKFVCRTVVENGVEGTRVWRKS